MEYISLRKIQLNNLENVKKNVSYYDWFSNSTISIYKFPIFF